MDHIRKQARIARRRLTSERFWRFLPWTLSAGFLVAMIGLALPKVMHLEVDATIWFASWVGGACAIALITNISMTFVGRPSLADSAVEIDRRFDMRERLSSALVLGPEDRDTELGAALVEDANRRAEKLDVREKFRWGINGGILWPAIPALLAALLLWVPDRAAPELAAQEKPQELSVTQVKNSTKRLLAITRKKRKEAEAKGLQAAVDLFRKLEGELAEMQKSAKLDSKQTLAKLNDIKQQIEERKQELGSAEAMRQNLKSLEKFESGPAEKLADALKKGDFEKAEESLQELMQKMQSGEMSPEATQKLEKQLEQLQKAMQEAAQAHEKAKQALQEQIAQAQAAGDMQKAAQLQRKMEAMQGQDANMAQMQQMADMLEQAQQAMEQGNMQQAQQALQEMASQMQQMNMSDQQLQDLDQLMDQLSDSKSQMMCDKCSGMGCQSCMMGQMPSDMMAGQGMGEGQGRGDRPEEETDVDFFDSQVRERMRRGETIYAGRVSGENKKGVTQVEVQEAVVAAMTEEPEALNDVPLPKTQRDHSSEYFEQIREGR